MSEQKSLDSVVQEILLGGEIEAAMKTLLLAQNKDDASAKAFVAHGIALALITLRDYSKTSKEFQAHLDRAGITSSVAETTNTIN